MEVCSYILPSSVSHDISYPLLFIYLMTLQIRFYFSSLVPKLPIRSFPMCTPPILRLQPFSVYDNVRLGNDALELRTDSDSLPSCVCLHLGLQQELGRVGKWTVKKEKSSNYCPLFFFKSSWWCQDMPRVRLNNRVLRQCYLGKIMSE